MSKFKAAMVFAYVIVGFATFGHVFNSNYQRPGTDCGVKPNVLDNPEGWDEWYWCRNPKYIHTTAGAAFPAVYAGGLWPVYWSGRIAIAITAPSIAASIRTEGTAK